MNPVLPVSMILDAVIWLHVAGELLKLLGTA